MESLKKDVKEIKVGSSNFDLSIFEAFKNPVCIIEKQGEISFTNNVFDNTFNTSSEKSIKIDWKDKLYPEYKKRLATTYIEAMEGKDKQCFAILKTDAEKKLPVELNLFPIFENNKVSSILVIMQIISNEKLAFTDSTLEKISEDNFNYENLHYEFSPIPTLRINKDLEITKCSHSLEGLIEYTEDNLIDKQIKICDLFQFSSDKIKKSILSIFDGKVPFKRIGEIKITTKEKKEKLVNLTIYPLIRYNEIHFLQIVMEDITKIYKLKEKINTLNRMNLFSDITKGFLHSLNNTINVILSKTQLLLQMTEKKVVLDGIKMIEESSLRITNQVHRVQNFINEGTSSNSIKTESLLTIIEDAIEFSKIQLKVDDTEKRRKIDIEKKYCVDVNININTILLREIIISIILKISTMIQKKGILEVVLKEKNDISLLIKAKKNSDGQNISPLAYTVNIFSGLDIRQVAEKLKIKIIEEESPEYYSIRAILPSKTIIRPQKTKEEKSDYKLRDLDILIVEDEKALQKILHELFDKMGNRVFICENGNDALNEFKRHHYDLLLTDYGITGIHGIELATRIKEIDEKTVTVLLSGWIITEINSYKNVIDLFVPKPFKLDELILKVGKIFTRKLEETENNLED